MAGMLAGWLAGDLLPGAGFSMIGDVTIGILGVFIGTWLLPSLGIRIGLGLVNAAGTAATGAILLARLVLRLVR